MEILEQRQVEQRVTATLLDFRQYLLQPILVVGGDHEPQVEAMLALVVVIDRVETVDDRRDCLEFVLGHRHRRQRACAETVGSEHGADAADCTLGLQALEGFEHRGLVDAEVPRDFGEGALDQWQTLLKLVQQASLETGVLPSHRPIRWAREVKNMPLGRLAGIESRRSKLAVS